ncbi:hypothetical protein MJA45_18710 [Paenibacillus aurantius]|uniref:STAS domain-containing protein n=1 Tax=Paenibacillus aurantius TaxID=2918900 RepID=A0AA96LCD5_9BACL|nr:hypothetical protein [Paenibacillus aurantius]WNQ09650.1 hypothetical protein MJA45_18710 [Paenibacillus aurantius]
MNIVQFPDKYTLPFFPDVCEFIASKESTIISVGSMVLDLSATTFVDPFGMVTLIGLCRHMYNSHGVTSTIVLPNGDAGSYMERAGFTQNSLIDNFIVIERRNSLLKYFRKSNKNMGVLWFFEGESDIQTINGEIEGWMEANGFSEEEINSITTFISEMVQNVCQHSNTPQKGVLCFQAYKTINGESFLSWAIGDAGIGIRQSLIDSGVQDIVGYDDERVIREVITKGISRFQDDKTRGNGLSRLYKAAQKRRAMLFIQSHAGLFGLHIDVGQLKKIERKVPLVTGTNIGFHLSRA